MRWAFAHAAGAWVLHRTEGLNRFRYEPPYARLRDDPRYGAMLDRMGLPR